MYLVDGKASFGFYGARGEFSVRFRPEADIPSAKFIAMMSDRAYPHPQALFLGYQAWTLIIGFMNTV